MKWEKVAIEKLPIDLIDGDRGTNYPKMNEFYDEEYCLFLNTSNVLKTGFDFSKCQFINQEKDEKLRKGKLSKDDIVLTTRGTLGNTGYFSDKVSFDNIRINSGMIIMRNKDKKQLDSSFIYYSIRENNFQTQIVNARSGSAQPQLPIGTLKKLKFSLPPLPTQRNIAAILSAYDDLIENNLKRIKLLEEKAFLRYKLLEKIEKYKLEELYDTSSGGTPSRTNSDFFKGEINWFKSKELEDSVLLESEEKITEVAIEKSSAKLFPAGSVIMAMYGATIGKLGLLSLSSTTNQACCAIMSKENVKSNFYILNWLLENREYILSFRMGAAQENISQLVIKNLIVSIPTDSDLEDFNSEMRHIYSMILNLHKQNTKLRAARDILLPRLMSGQIEV